MPLTDRALSNAAGGLRSCSRAGRQPTRIKSSAQSTRHASVSRTVPKSVSPLEHPALNCTSFSLGRFSSSGGADRGSLRSQSTQAKVENPNASPSIRVTDFQNVEDYDDIDDIDDDEEEDTFVASYQPWKTLLDAPSRAAWRVTDPRPPVALQESLEEILKTGNRTSKQLKRAHRKVLEIHKILAEGRERERRRLVNGKYYRGKDASDDGGIEPVYYGYDETLATLKHRMFPNYAIARRVLDECKSLVGMNPSRVVDFGIGCGSASAAALDLFGDRIEWIHGIDPALPMRECSQRLLEGMSERDEGVVRPPRITFSTSLSSDTNTMEGSFDLALFAYSATDLPDITSTLAAAAMLFQKLKPNGVFVMIEPGTPDGFNSIRSVRSMLLDCCPPDDPEFEWHERCHVIAPCTHNGSCPMVRHKKEFIKKQKLAYDLPQDLEANQEDSQGRKGEEDAEFIEMSTSPDNISESDAFSSSFCSFVQAIPGSDSRRGEKFSYLVVQKRIHGDNENVQTSFEEKDNLSKLLALAHSASAQEDAKATKQVYEYVQDLESRYLDSVEDDLGLELLRGESKRSSMGRIVRAPIKKKGHVYIDYCAAPGRIIRSRVAKSSTNIAPGVWSAARKSRWGGFWPDTMDKIYFETSKNDQK